MIEVFFSVSDTGILGKRKIQDLPAGSTAVSLTENMALTKGYNKNKYECIITVDKITRCDHINKFLGSDLLQFATVLSVFSL